MSAEKTAKTAGEKRPVGEKSSVKTATKSARTTTKRSPKATEAVAAPVVTEVAPVAEKHVVTEKKAAEKKVAEKKVVEKKTVEKAVKTVRSAATLAHGVGRRKAAVARVYLKLGTGVITVNGLPSDEYFDTDTTRSAAKATFVAVPAAMRYDVLANVYGGGISGQADAVKLGISRALLQIDPEVRAVLRQNGLLTVDDRVKERKKYGRKAARRSFQFVKR